MNKLLIIVICIAILSAGGVFYILSTNKTISQIQTTQTTQDTQTITLATVTQHNTESNCWMAIDGIVYDVTTYIPAHPGNEIVKGCGKEATSLFTNERKHNGKAIAMLDQFRIGTLGNQ